MNGAHEVEAEREKLTKRGGMKTTLPIVKRECVRGYLLEIEVDTPDISTLISGNSSPSPNLGFMDSWISWPLVDFNIQDFDDIKK